MSTWSNFQLRFENKARIFVFVILCSVIGLLKSFEQRAIFSVKGTPGFLWF